MSAAAPEGPAKEPRRFPFAVLEILPLLAAPGMAIVGFAYALCEGPGWPRSLLSARLLMFLAALFILVALTGFLSA